MSISINEIKNGLTILLDGAVYQVISSQHVKPGKGSAFVRTKLRNLKTGIIIERTFKGDEEIEEAFVEERKLQFLYKKANTYHFMDQETFEEITFLQDILGENIYFLKENLEVNALVYKGEILNINLPKFLELKVIYTEEGLRGDTVKAGTKSATLETGIVIQVPLFIKVGDIVKVDTQTKEYIERINL